MMLRILICKENITLIPSLPGYHQARRIAAAISMMAGSFLQEILPVVSGYGIKNQARLYTPLIL